MLKLPRGFTVCELPGDEPKGIATAKSTGRTMTSGDYNYPKYDEVSGYVKVPSQQLSDALVEAFKDRLKAD